MKWILSVSSLRSTFELRCHSQQRCFLFPYESNSWGCKYMGRQTLEAEGSLVLFLYCWSDSSHNPDLLLPVVRGGSQCPKFNIPFHCPLRSGWSLLQTNKWSLWFHFSFQQLKGFKVSEKNLALLYALYMLNVDLFKDANTMKYWGKMRMKICVPCCLSEVLLYLVVSVQNCWFGITPVESFGSQAYFVTRQLLLFILTQDSYTELVLLATEIVNLWIHFLAYNNDLGKGACKHYCDVSIWPQRAFLFKKRNTFFLCVCACYRICSKHTEHGHHAGVLLSDVRWPPGSWKHPRVLPG